MFQLEILHNDQSRTIEVEGEVVVGRGPDVDLELDSAKVAPSHCRFFLQDEVLALNDFGSSFGTFIEGIRLGAGKTTLLKDGDVVVIGDVSVVVREEKNQSKIRHEKAGMELSLDDLGLEREKTRVGIQVSELTANRVEKEEFEMEEIPEQSLTLDLEEKNEEVKTQDQVTVSRLIKEIDQNEGPQKQANLKTPRIKRGPKVRASGVKAVGGVKKIQTNQTRSKKIAGPLSRLLALFIDLSLVWILHTLAQNFSWYQVDLLSAHMMSRYPFLTHTLALGLYLFVLLCLFKALVNLFLGASLGQLCLGIWGSQARIKNRLGGFGRSLLEFFLLPLSWMNLGLIFGFRTLPEVLSGTKLKQGSTTLRAIGSFIILPLIFIAAIASPLLIRLEQKEGFTIQKNTLRPTPAAQYDNIPYFRLDSSYYQLSGSYNKVHKFVLLPHYAENEIALSLYYLPNQQWGEVSVYKSISLKRILKSFARDYPLVREKFPFIYRFSQMQESDSFFSTSLREEIHLLVMTSFRLGTLNLLDHVLSYGPFLHPFIVLRENFLKLLPKRKKIDVQLQALGNAHFLKMEASPIDNLKREIVYYPLDAQEAKTWFFSWEGEDELAHERFVRHFLATQTWTYDRKMPEGEMRPEEINLFNVLAIYQNAQISEELKRACEKFLASWYFEIGKKIVKGQGSLSLTTHLVRILDELSEKARKNEKRENESAIFRARLGEMKNALTEQKPEYFELP